MTLLYLHHDFIVMTMDLNALSQANRGGWRPASEYGMGASDYMEESEDDDDATLYLLSQSEDDAVEPEPEDEGSATVEQPEPKRRRQCIDLDP